MIRNLPGDLDACCKADLAFHREILAASHNLVFAQLAGTIGAALEATFRISTELSRSYERTIEAHREVLEAIRLRDRAAAEARMRALHRRRPGRPGTRDRAGAVTVAPVWTVPLHWLTSSTPSRRES